MKTESKLTQIRNMFIPTIKPWSLCTEQLEEGTSLLHICFSNAVFEEAVSSSHKESKVLPLSLPKNNGRQYTRKALFSLTEKEKQKETLQYVQPDEFMQDTLYSH